MSTQRPKPPAPLQAETVPATIIRDHIWAPANLQDNWRMFAVVGREGTGKSLTCASILKAVDPAFGVEDTHFDPVPFLEDVGRELDERGNAVMSDESGVGFGNRTWHDREQVEANQALQTARDYNRVIGLTLPRIEELDKQLRGRLHHLIETIQKKDGEYVRVKWKTLSPSRSGQDKIYQGYDTRRIEGRVQEVKTLTIGPPPEGYIDTYQQKKAEWKEELFGRVIDRYEEGEGDEAEEKSTKEIAEEIVEECLDEYIADNHGQTYIDKQLIGADYDLGHRRSKQVKKLIEREVDVDAF